MKIKWLGHSCFVLETKDGIKILTDPYESGGYGGAVGYGKIDEEANIVTVSHSHADHNSVESVPGKFDVVKDESQRNFNGINIRGVKTFHDNCGGKARGENIVYVIEAEGLNICHLGDLGEVLSDEKAQEIGSIDILMIPVGGHFTIGPADADAVAEKLDPKIVIPMHYKTEVLDFPIAPVDEYLENKKSFEVLDSYEIEFSTLPAEKKIIVFNHKL